MPSTKCYLYLVRLHNKVAVITGGGSGIGRACALAFAREGANVALVGRRKPLLDEVAHQIGPEHSIAIPFDITSRGAGDAVLKRVLQRFRAVHVLVNSAGVLIPGTAESLTDKQWQETFDINVRALWTFSRAVLPYLRKSGGGSIINLSSVLGLVGAHNRVAYAASKGAVTLMTKSMALDLARENIRVNCICPGIIETELVADVVRKAPDPKAARRQREALHAMNRFGQPAEVADLAVFLASDESSFITGAALTVDGGYSAGKA